MIVPRRGSLTVLLLLWLWLGLTATTTAEPADTAINLTIANAAILPDSTRFYVDVYLDSPNDSVAGVSLYVSVSNPELMYFDASQLLPIRGVDTTGTLLSGWQLVNSISPSGVWSDIQIVALANIVEPPYNPGFAPQSGGLLLRLIGHLKEPLPADSLTELRIDTALTKTGFSTPRGYLIGIITETYIDTFYYACEHWDGDSCLSWVQVLPSQADTAIIDTIPFSYYDTTASFFNEGALRVVTHFPGDANNDWSVNVADGIFLINYVFKSGPAPDPLDYGDANCDAVINVGDIVKIINYIFSGGAAPGCWE